MYLTDAVHMFILIIIIIKLSEGSVSKGKLSKLRQNFKGKLAKFWQIIRRQTIRMPAAGKQTTQNCLKAKHIVSADDLDRMPPGGQCGYSPPPPGGQSGYSLLGGQSGHSSPGVESGYSPLGGRSGYSPPPPPPGGRSGYSPSPGGQSGYSPSSRSMSGESPRSSSNS